MRYLDPKNTEEFASAHSQDAWMPVDFYSGGAEHTTMHLLYSRFFYKALYDLGYVTSHEPYKKRMNRGLILGPDGAKMSKSKGNVIDPDEVVENVGADSVRLYLAFIGPYNEIGSYPWDSGGVVGVRRFLERVWSLKEKVSPDASNNPSVEVLLHKTIKKVGEEIESLKLNTGISALMELTNALLKEESVSKEIYETLLVLLSPYAPHITEELWNSLGNKESIHTKDWPEHDPQKLVSKEMTIVVQVNGKLRTKITVKSDADEASVKAMAQKEAQKWLKDSDIKKVIYVKDRLVNFVI